MKSRIFICLVCLLSVIPLLRAERTDAISNQAVIWQIQTGGSGSGTASEEAVIIKNTSETPAKLTNWCMQYSPAANGTTFTTLGCIKTSEVYDIWLEAGGLLRFATDSFLQKNPSFLVDASMSVSLAAAGGHVRFVDSQGFEVDRVGWGTASVPEGLPAPAPVSGMLISRSTPLEHSDTDTGTDTDNNANDFITSTALVEGSSGLYEVEIPRDICLNIEGLQTTMPADYEFDATGDCVMDVCATIDGLQTEVPVGYALDQESQCVLVVLEDRPLLITEILPNAQSYDDGLEFIEIYNPNESVVHLKGYTIALGPEYLKTYVFDFGDILPGEYISITDSESNLVMPNTEASLRLIAPAGNIVSETELYNNPGEGMSWSLLEGGWMFTEHATPGTANLLSLEVDEDGTSANSQVDVASSPCPAGKVRNSDTNRCRAIVLGVSSSLECPEGQYRNPATNRCKKLAVVASSLASCKAGQERNPETNRCKSTASSNKELLPCKEGEERNPETNRCKKAENGVTPLGGIEDVYTATSSSAKTKLFLLVGAVMCALAYVAYEWRKELAARIFEFKNRAWKLRKS